MLNTFDNDNAMLLASIQELTTELATAQSKIAELENGGGGGEVVPYINGNFKNIISPYQMQQRNIKIGDYVEEPISRPTTGIWKIFITSVQYFDTPVALDYVEIHLPNGSSGGISTDAIWIALFDIEYSSFYIGLYNNEYIIGIEGGVG